jgi:hypothetical protein
MQQAPNSERLDIAILPLADGRKAILPLEILAEVLRLDDQENEVGQLSWRGHELALESLDAFCGLEGPAPAEMTTVGIFRAHCDSAAPFRALAFSGNADHSCITAATLEGTEAVMFIPDLGELLYGCS